MQLSSRNSYIVACLGVIDIWWMNFSQGFFVFESRYIGPHLLPPPKASIERWHMCLSTNDQHLLSLDNYQ